MGIAPFEVVSIIEEVLPSKEGVGVCIPGIMVLALLTLLRPFELRSNVEEAVDDAGLVEVEVVAETTLLDSM